jgi:hypothetical protein
LPAILGEDAICQLLVLLSLATCAAPRLLAGCRRSYAVGGEVDEKWNYTFIDNLLKIHGYFRHRCDWQIWPVCPSCFSGLNGWA